MNVDMEKEKLKDLFLLRLPLSLSAALNVPHVHDAWCKGLSETQKDFFLMDAKDSKMIDDVTVASLNH
ncbi:hypothetical protein I315_04370 [Cryptococcus gattii Ru294]|uniref:Uncharacterized protein n=2 Tax=Cryptococcus gattii TaxID=37769 RepID=E6R1A5_CRYGW|nr:Hypothetical Protein CGB_B6740W [Cryptococcus gattii WM276]KIR53332.1 hypothetical protein I315_04370 [Cryptococcus gattii Ru294]KIR76881.1 hypothetical protein I306_06138 [Cryptococcus gattii EJB2]KIY31278.1 hypothetical protein I305_06182 [Cryptococcus gattii E566]KJE01696.1 hypothetical protein I311_04734 [Cryptococcus gattii NT-10]ADV20566.1 Hypothetical Protein CGB_B6740W [Cryptococcus gattii WM276]